MDMLMLICCRRDGEAMRCDQNRTGHYSVI
jgi:hypothetical protein